MILEVGRVCKKVRGRNAGELCVVIKKPEKKRVLVEGRTIKRKEVNIMHLEPLPVVLKIKKEPPREELLKALEEAGF